MSFATPIWLVALVPWAGVVVWMLLGRRQGVSVPFIALWRGNAAMSRSRRRVIPPSWSLIAALASVMFAILAAAGPRLGVGTSVSRVTVILDRGISMSSKGRIAEVVDAARQAIPAKAEVTFLTVPSAEVSGWDDARKLAGTCVDTAATLNRMVPEAMLANDGLVLVLSDQPVRVEARVVRIPPEKRVENVAVARVALRSSPTTQAMVTVRNDSTKTQAALVVEGVKRSIELPGLSQEGDFFVDLPTAGEKVRVGIEVADDFDGDNAAYLARARAGAAIEIRGNVSPDVRRVVEAYRSARAGGGERVVAVAGATDALTAEQAGIVAPPLWTGSESEISEGVPTVRPHPVTTHLDAARWKNVRLAKLADGADWHPVILMGDQPAVAVREKPAREVWIGLESEAWAQSPDFVILWTNALDWVCGGDSGSAETTYSAKEVGTLDPEWKPADGRDLWPGFYERSDGATLAANAPAVKFRTRTAAEDWRGRLASLNDAAGESGAAMGASGRALVPYLLMAAMTCALIAAWLWPRSALTAFSPARTV